MVEAKSASIMSVGVYEAWTVLSVWSVPTKMFWALEMRTEPKVRQMRGLDSLKVAESRVAFDAVVMLEAVKLSRVHIHPRQYLDKTK